MQQPADGSKICAKPAAANVNLHNNSMRINANAAFWFSKQPQSNKPLTLQNRQCVCTHCRLLQALVGWGARSSAPLRTTALSCCCEGLVDQQAAFVVTRVLLCCCVVEGFYAVGTCYCKGGGFAAGCQKLSELQLLLLLLWDC
jgi:hypothetical protein